MQARRLRDATTILKSLAATATPVARWRMGYCPSTKVYGQKLSNAGRQVRYNNRAMLTWLALFFAKRMKTKEVHAGAKALLIAHAGRRCVGCGGDSPGNIFECTVCSH